MAERIAKDLAAEGRLLDDEETKETAFFRLESLGYRVGQGLAERCGGQFTTIASSVDHSPLLLLLPMREC